MFPRSFGPTVYIISMSFFRDLISMFNLCCVRSGVCVCFSAVVNKIERLVDDGPKLYKYQTNMEGEQSATETGGMSFAIFI